MDTEQRRAFCNYCKCERTFGRRAVDHRFHGMVTCCTLGLWAPVWVAVCFYSRFKQPWRCWRCTHRLRSKDSSIPYYGDDPFATDDGGPDVDPKGDEAAFSELSRWTKSEEKVGHPRTGPA